MICHECGRETLGACVDCPTYQARSGAGSELLVLSCPLDWPGPLSDRARVLLRGLAALSRGAAKVAADEDTPKRAAALARLDMLRAKAQVRIALHGTWKAQALFSFTP